MGGCRVFCSTNLLISASTDESNFSAPAEDDVGAFISFSVTGLASSPNPGRYFHLVNKLLRNFTPKREFNLSGAGGLAATAGPLMRPPAAVASWRFARIMRSVGPNRQFYRSR